MRTQEELLKSTRDEGDIVRKDETISELIKAIRSKSLRERVTVTDEQLKKPVSFWIKQDRLLGGPGKEFTVILKTKGCGWALSESGGCSMCGYVQDSCAQEIDPARIIDQFDFALQAKRQEIEKDSDKYSLKIFNSGSFFDDREVPQSVRRSIYERIAKINNVKEVVFESRPEYLNAETLAELKNDLKNNYIEIGIGLESVSDYVRINYINKGFLFKEFVEKLKLCKELGVGVKAYLMFKPPFLGEQAAIDDCAVSIRRLIELEVNSISINPLNVQKGTLAEFLWYRNQYRPPWFYSLFKCIKRAVRQTDLKKVRVVSDPSGAGTNRGIHNCSSRECNESMKKALEQFVLSQDLRTLNVTNDECVCKLEYRLKKDFC